MNFAPQKRPNRIIPFPLLQGQSTIPSTSWKLQIFITLQKLLLNDLNISPASKHVLWKIYRFLADGTERKIWENGHKTKTHRTARKTVLQEWSHISCSLSMGYRISMGWLERLTEFVASGKHINSQFLFWEFQFIPEGLYFNKLEEFKLGVIFCRKNSILLTLFYRALQKRYSLQNDLKIIFK